MGVRGKLSAAVLALVLVSAVPVGSARADDPAFFSFSAAWFDVNKQDDSALEGRIEYRSDKKFWFLKPFGGVMGTSDGAAHGYVGVLVDIYFGRRIVVTPSFAPGFYEEGSGLDLGHEVEFRSQIEFAYRFDDRSRLGVAVSHMSNAGLGDSNPGTESAMLYYSIPFDTLFGR